MPDPLFVLVALMCVVGLWGLGFTAGRNYQRRHDRAWYR